LVEEQAMPSQNQHDAEQPTTQNQNNAMSGDPADGHRLTDNPQATAGTPAEKKPPQDQQDQATVEEFGREGMGVAAKE
jgi:hypothetical protein